MRIAAITNPIHITRTPPASGGAQRHYMVIHNMSMRSLRNHVCHAVAEDAKTPVICSRECDHYRYCEFGREYMRRVGK